MFNIIHHRGIPKRAETLRGQGITRQEKIYVPEYGRQVPCAPYDDHFVYADPTVGQSAYMCTCGSAAVIAAPERGAGQMFVCLHHATYGKHQTSMINLKDYGKHTQY